MEEKELESGDAPVTTNLETDHDQTKGSVKIFFEISEFFTLAIFCSAETWELDGKNGLWKFEVFAIENRLQKFMFPWK